MMFGPMYAGLMLHQMNRAKSLPVREVSACEMRRLMKRNGFKNIAMQMRIHKAFGDATVVVGEEKLKLKTRRNSNA